MTTSESEGKASSRSWGRAQTLKPVREWRHTAYYSLEECLHLAQLKIRNLPDQTAIVKRRGQRTVRVKTVEIKPLLKCPPVVARFRSRIAERSSFIVPFHKAKAHVDGRLIEFSGKSEPASSADGTFWHPES